MILLERVMLTREGVGVHERILYALEITNQFHRELLGREATIYSILDGRHHAGSRHYVGLAFDLRIWSIPESSLVAFKAELQRRLGIHYDVILEPTHIHVEFDPPYESI